MGTGILLATIGMAVVFDVTNGFHDSANSVAALVATRAATPVQALVVATAGNFAGPLLMGTAVADTVAGVVIVAPHETLPAIGAALSAAIGWNLVTWRFGLPSSSSHALIGGLVGAAVTAGGMGGVRWGGMAHGKPDGVLGVLTGLAISPVLGVLVGAVGIVLAGRLLRRARREFNVVVRRGEWLTASALAFSHGANDAQKTMGVVALLLLASGHLASFSVPIWVRLLAAGSLTIGTAFGGQPPRSTAWQTALTVVQEARPPFIPEGAEVMTVIIEFPPGDPGTPPHRHPGPAFGCMLEGEMRFELEGEPERVIRAGEAFWEPGGDVIHYQDGNNRTDIRSRFLVTMLCVPGKPMLTLVDEDELAQRKDHRAPRPT